MLTIAFCAEMGYAVLNISAMPVYLSMNRGFGESVIGLVLVAFLLSEAVFKGPMGHLADRFGCKRLMLMGPSLTIGTSLLTLAVPHSWGLSYQAIAIILMRVVDGIGAAMLWPAAFAMMGDTVEDDCRQQSMSLMNMCYLLAVALALPIGGIANDATFGILFQMHYPKPEIASKGASLYLAALLFAIVVTVVYRLIPSDASKIQAGSEHDKGFNVGEFLRAAKQIPAYLTLSLVTFAGIGFPMAIIKLFAKDQFQMSETQFGFLVLPGAAALASLSVPMSRFGESLGRFKAVHFGMGLCSIGLWIIALGGFVPFLRSPWVLALGGIPVGLGFLLAIPAWMASVSDIDKNRRATNLGAVMTAQGVGAIIGAPLGGAFYQTFQTFSPDFGRYSPFMGCAACVTGGWLIALKILRPRAQTE